MLQHRPGKSAAPRTLSDTFLCAWLRWNDTGRMEESGPCQRVVWGVVNALSTWQLWPPWASTKAGSAAPPVNLTFHVGHSYTQGWSLIVGLWALLWRRHNASVRVASTRPGPSRFSVWGLRNVNSSFCIPPFWYWTSEKSCALCSPPHCPQSRANTMEERNALSYRGGKNDTLMIRHSSKM